MIENRQTAGMTHLIGISHLPGWIKQYRLRHEGQTIWLDLEPETQTEDSHPGQMVVDLPPGRYMVEILDTVSGEWISRESAAGGPLVAGLQWTGNPLTVRITQSRTGK
jgi:hypothetical protein